MNKRQTIHTVLITACMIFLSGCSTHPLSGSAAMRIDVEVYKGPLSEEPEVQWGVLLGDLEETMKGLSEADTLARAVIANKGFKGVNGELPAFWPIRRTNIWDGIREKARDGIEDYVSKEKIPDTDKVSLNETFGRFWSKKHMWESQSIDPAERTEIDRVAAQVHELLDKAVIDIDHLTGPTQDQKKVLKRKLEEIAVQEEIGRKLEYLCRNVQPVGLLKQLNHFDCLILVSLVSDIQEVITQLDGLQKNPDFKLWFRGHPPPTSVLSGDANVRGVKPELSADSEKIKEFLSRLSKIGAICRLKAFRLAIGGIPAQPMDWKVRMAVVTTIVATSEYGNQLKTRSDALMKQIDQKGGHDRRELPPGVALRDSNPTDFIELYRWFDGASYSFVTKYWQGIGSVGDRTKALVRLFSDHFWSKVNTVYASGRGKVGMALIKDEVGNWNLKSFDNDPEQLLRSYTGVATTLLKSAADLAQALTVGAAGSEATIVIKQLIDMANRAAFPGSGGTGTDELAKGLEQTLVAQLNRKTEEFEMAEKRLMTEHEAASSKDIVPQKIVQNRERYLYEIELILEKHSRTIDSMAQGLSNTHTAN